MKKKYLLALAPVLLGFTWILAEIPFAEDLRAQLKPIGSFSRPCCTLAPSDAYGKFIKKVMKYKEIGLENLGLYSFGNHAKNENNGQLYTCRAGFIDTSHLRHVLDWTVYFFEQINKLTIDNLVIELPKEGGHRKIFFDAAILNLDLESKASIAQKISYDLAVWHEILTWYVPSTFLIKERVSSFSPEDLFSNNIGGILGHQILIEMIRGKKQFSLEEYEKRVDDLVRQTLTEFGGMSAEKTYAAFKLTSGVWWNPAYHLPRFRATLKREFTAYGDVPSHLAPGQETLGCSANVTAMTMPSPEAKWDEYYSLQIRPKNRVPVKKMLKGERKLDNRTVSQTDFPAMIQYIRANMEKKLGTGIGF